MRFYRAKVRLPVPAEGWEHDLGAGGGIELYNDEELQELRRAYEFMVSGRRFDHAVDQLCIFLLVLFAGLGASKQSPAGIPMGW